MSAHDHPTRHRILLGLLWLAIGSWGFALGAKVFDLVVLGASWAAHPPESLALLPYGKRYPVNPGDFFQPLSLVILVSAVGALIAGWKGSKRLRRRLWWPVVALAIIWILTPTIFWPIIIALYDAAQGRMTPDAGSLADLVHRWFVWDWCRVALIAAGFVTQAGALTTFLRSGLAHGPR